MVRDKKKILTNNNLVNESCNFLLQKFTSTIWFLEIVQRYSLNIPECECAKVGAAKRVMLQPAFRKTRFLKCHLKGTS